MCGLLDSRLWSGSWLCVQPAVTDSSGSAEPRAVPAGQSQTLLSLQPRGGGQSTHDVLRPPLREVMAIPAHLLGTRGQGKVPSETEPVCMQGGPRPVGGPMLRVDGLPRDVRLDLHPLPGRLVIPGQQGPGGAGGCGLCSPGLSVASCLRPSARSLPPLPPFPQAPRRMTTSLDAQPRRSWRPLAGAPTSPPCPRRSGWGANTPVGTAHRALPLCWADFERCLVFPPPPPRNSPSRVPEPVRRSSPKERADSGEVSLPGAAQVAPAQVPHEGRAATPLGLWEPRGLVTQIGREARRLLRHWA